MKIQHQYLGHSSGWSADGWTSASWSVSRERSLNPSGNRYLSYMGRRTFAFSYFATPGHPRSVLFRRIRS